MYGFYFLNSNFNKLKCSILYQQVSEMNSEPASRNVFNFLSTILVSDRIDWLLEESCRGRDLKKKFLFNKWSEGQTVSKCISIHQIFYFNEAKINSSTIIFWYLKQQQHWSEFLKEKNWLIKYLACLLYTSDAADDWLVV